MSVGRYARETGNIRAVDYDVVVRVERFEPFLDGIEVQRAGDVLGAVGPLAQGHNQLKVVRSIQLLLELVAADELHS
jgi:hypothetical protein